MRGGSWRGGKEERPKFDVELSAVSDLVFCFYKMSCWADWLNIGPLRHVDRLSGY